jgi:hypothetical protein
MPLTTHQKLQAQEPSSPVLWVGSVRAWRWRWRWWRQLFRGAGGYTRAAGSGMWSKPAASAAEVVVDVGLGAHLDHR